MCGGVLKIARSDARNSTEKSPIDLTIIRRALNDGVCQCLIPQSCGSIIKRTNRWWDDGQRYKLGPHHLAGRCLRFIYDAVSAGKSCTICSFLCLDEIVTRGGCCCRWNDVKWDRMNKREREIESVSVYVMGAVQYRSTNPTCLRSLLRATWLSDDFRNIARLDSCKMHVSRGHMWHVARGAFTPTQRKWRSFIMFDCWSSSVDVVLYSQPPQMALLYFVWRLCGGSVCLLFNAKNMDFVLCCRCVVNDAHYYAQYAAIRSRRMRCLITSCRRA